jgi:hypothetical protein
MDAEMERLLWITRVSLCDHQGLQKREAGKPEGGKRDMKTEAEAELYGVITQGLWVISRNCKRQRNRFSFRVFKRDSSKNGILGFSFLEMQNNEVVLF